ncbi:hypothetical protein C3941_14725 [Kaistia algarum]|uniref:hypothetical protein n=1 Tax=Kaistia algarum TaxID=2083279 RepID=UPI000CE7581F|nr:hypothetical protein [Kaistia algarum]MCX5514327.1 hypothetical protein [Kaistia algarum]PPE79078.1 hypothetical protein C3941_14725 [Kaistia algarum]
MTDAERAAAPEILTHPEEIRSSFELRIGKHITLEGHARITPAGVICSGIAAAAMTMALGYVLAATAKRR